MWTLTEGTDHKRAKRAGGGHRWWALTLILVDYFARHRPSVGLIQEEGRIRDRATSRYSRTTEVAKTPMRLRAAAAYSQVG
jgi:hypothetical protein